MSKSSVTSASKLGFHDPIPVLAKRLTNIQQVNAMTGIRNSTIRYWERRCSSLRSESIGHGARRRYRPDQFVLLLALNELIVHLGVTVDGASAMVESLNFQGYIKDLSDRSQTSITRLDVRNLLLSHMNCVFASPSQQAATGQNDPRFDVSIANRDGGVRWPRLLPADASESSVL